MQIFPWNPEGTWVDIAVASALLLLVALVCTRGVVVSAKSSLGLLIFIVLCIALSLITILLPPSAASSASNETIAEHTGVNATTFRDNGPPHLSAFAGSPDSSLMLM